MGHKTLMYRLKSGKNSKFKYYARNFFRLYCVPDRSCRARREALLRDVASRQDREYIMARVDYYCKLNGTTPLGEDARVLEDFHRRDERSAYFFDSYEYVRFFPKSLRWRYTFGDIRDLQPAPSIVKSRPLGDDNANSVLLNLVKNRHFVFLNDGKDFSDKKDMAVFRGKIADKPWRIEFMERWFDDPDCDCGEVGRHLVRPEWEGSMMSLYQHLDYKFILALEGNDVASNLKWVMSSNSLAVMPKPTCETWFMEGKLVGGYHYVEIKPDFSDLKEKMEYYASHPDEARRIIKNANEWVRQFKDSKREQLISLLVLDKYFRMTGQNPDLAV
jgi:hypothetical protein